MLNSPDSFVVSLPLCAHQTSVLSLQSHFFEFAPATEPTDRTCLAHELSIGKRYGVIVTTGGGLYRYRTGDIVTVEGNAYFPLASVTPGVLVDSAATSVCPWKGEASYFSVQVDGQTNADAAWTYRSPKAAAAEIADRVAFWKGVVVS